MLILLMKPSFISLHERIFCRWTDDIVKVAGNRCGGGWKWQVVGQSEGLRGRTSFDDLRMMDE